MSTKKRLQAKVYDRQFYVKMCTFFTLKSGTRHSLVPDGWGIGLTKDHQQREGDNQHII